MKDVRHDEMFPFHLSNDDLLATRVTAPAQIGRPPPPPDVWV